MYLAADWRDEQKRNSELKKGLDQSVESKQEENYRKEHQTKKTT